MLRPSIEAGTKLFPHPFVPSNHQTNTRTPTIGRGIVKVPATLCHSPSLSIWNCADVQMCFLHLALAIYAQQTQHTTQWASPFIALTSLSNRPLRVVKTKCLLLISPSSSSSSIAYSFFSSLLFLCGRHTHKQTLLHLIYSILRFCVVFFYSADKQKKKYIKIFKEYK